ncbi:MAG: biotin--[acetyl-CoA-carboxylase] ligase [Chlamydiales bacterium]|nr:biotin--[acetyl-CoA-carboxylase] ligase [Chlamydiales bacterium]
MITNITKYHFQSISSTNDWAKENIHLFNNKELTLVTADMQTAGRGQFGRRWHSPAKKNIYASIVFFLEQDRLDTSLLVQLLAKTVQSVLQENQLETQIKWPNDLLLGGKKLAGILIETSYIQDLTCVIMGIGINVNMPKKDLENVSQLATSLFIETNMRWDCNALMDRILQALMLQL